MRAVTVADGAVAVAEHPDPSPQAGEILVRVRGAGLNGADIMQLDNAVFTALAATGALAPELFKNLNLAAVDADDRILYDQVAGNLYYDSNGSGAGGRVLFAHIDNGYVMSSADFVVI